MSTEDPASVNDIDNENDNVLVNKSSKGRSSPSKKKTKKVPKRLQKAEREKLKRNQLNSHFLALASALELDEPKNGKASIVSETIKFLKHYRGLIDEHKKENGALLSESHYVTIERNELREENYVLEANIRELRCELEAIVSQSNAELHNARTGFHQVGLKTYLQADCFNPADVKCGQQEAPAVFVLPVHPELHAYPTSDPSQIAEKPMAHVSKPQPRYPSPADSWHSQLLTEEARRKEGTFI